jgi:hypothetical protein
MPEMVLTQDEVDELDRAMCWPLAHERELLVEIEKSAGRLDATSALFVRSACRLIADTGPGVAEAFVSALAKANEPDEPQATITRKAETMTDTDTHELDAAQVAANVIDLLKKAPQSAEVIMAALASDPELAAAYQQGISSGDGGRLLVAKAQRQAAIEKAQRPPKHPFLQLLDSRIAKAAGGEDYETAALRCAAEYPAEYDDFRDFSRSGRRR